MSYIVENFRGFQIWSWISILLSLHSVHSHLIISHRFYYLISCAVIYPLGTIYYCGSAHWVLVLLLSNWYFWAVLGRTEWKTLFFVLDLENAILIRLSLKAAMGDNAVSIINHYQALLQQRLHINRNLILTQSGTLIIYAISQYPWNSNEMYLFRANIAYALNQFYTLKNESTNFTLVLTSTHIMEMFFPCVTVVVTFVLYGFTELKMCWCTTRLAECPSIFWSKTRKLPPNIFQGLLWRRRYG